MTNFKNNSIRILLSTIFSVLFFSNFIFADPTDGCELGSNQLFLTDGGEVLFNSSADI